MDRRPFVLAATALLVLTGAACSNDDDGDDDATVDQTTTTAADATPTTVTTTSGGPDAPASTPTAAAKGLLRAWEKGDRNEASRYARQRAIDAIFAQPNTGDVDYADQGCEPLGGQFVCSWTYPGGVMQMTVEGVLGTDGFVVENVTYRAD